MTTPSAFGIDASWSGLAVCVVHGESVVHSRFSAPPKPGLSRYARLDQLGQQFMAAFTKAAPTVIAMEGYAFGTQNGREQAGELGGHLRWLLWKAGATPLIVPPTLLKTFVVGKGSAKKDQMMMHALKRWGFEAPDDDTCDAYCLAQFALGTVGEQTAQMRALLAKAPDLTGGTLGSAKKVRGKAEAE